METYVSFLIFQFNGGNKLFKTLTLGSESKTSDCRDSRRLKNIVVRRYQSACFEYERVFQQERRVGRNMELKKRIICIIRLLLSDFMHYADVPGIELPHDFFLQPWHR